MIGRGSACTVPPDSVEERCPDGSPAAAGCPCGTDSDCRSNYCIGTTGLGSIMKLGVCALSESPVLSSCKEAKDCGECVTSRAHGKLGIHYCVWSLKTAKRSYEHWPNVEPGYSTRKRVGCVAQKKSRSWSKNRWVDYMHRSQCSATVAQVEKTDPCATVPAPKDCRCSDHSSCASGMCQGKSMLPYHYGKCAENDVAKCATHSVSTLTASSTTSCKKKRALCGSEVDGQGRKMCHMDPCSRFSARACSPIEEGERHFAKVSNAE